MLMPSQIAVWKYKKGKRSIRISKAAVQLLLEHQKVDEKNLQLYVSRLFNPETLPLTNHSQLAILSIQLSLSTAAGIL
jgi:hypothetical protein